MLKADGCARDAAARGGGVAVWGAGAFAVDEKGCADCEYAALTAAFDVCASVEREGKVPTPALPLSVNSRLLFSPVRDEGP